MTRSTPSRPISGETPTASPITSTTSAKAQSTQASRSTICWPGYISSQTSPLRATRIMPLRGFIAISLTATPTSSPISPTSRRTSKFVCGPQDPTYKSGGRWMDQPLQHQRLPVRSCENYSGNRQPGLQPATYTQESGFTTVQLDLAARESVFVVLRNHGQPLPPQPAPTRHTVMTIQGPWTVTFPTALRCAYEYPTQQTQLLDGKLGSRSQVLLRHGDLFHYLHGDGLCASRQTPVPTSRRCPRHRADQNQRQVRWTHLGAPLRRRRHRHTPPRFQQTRDCRNE